MRTVHFFASSIHVSQTPIPSSISHSAALEAGQVVRAAVVWVQFWVSFLVWDRGSGISTGWDGMVWDDLITSTCGMLVKDFSIRNCRPSAAAMFWFAKRNRNRVKLGSHHPPVSRTYLIAVSGTQEHWLLVNGLKIKILIGTRAKISLLRRCKLFQANGGHFLHYRKWTKIIYQGPQQICIILTIKSIDTT